MEAFDFEVLDPALRPPLAKDTPKTEEFGSPWQRRSKLSRSPSIVVKRGASVHSTTPHSLSSVGPRSNSAPQEVDFKAESSSFSIREVSRRTHEPVDINEEDHKVATEGNKTASGIESRQVILSTDAEIVAKGAHMSPGGQTLQQIRRKSFDAFYDFSDEEDEIESVQHRRPVRFQAPDAVTNRRLVKTQIIDLSIEDSVPDDYTTTGRQALKSSPRKGNQYPISISSSSPGSDLSEFEEMKFFLEPSTPTPPVSDSPMTLSGILGPDDFEELRKSSPVPLKQPTQEKMKVPASEEYRKAPLDSVKSSPARHPTPKRRTPISTTRASMLRRSMEASPSDSMVETPGGSMQRCGENGFRCGKGFCFKCLEE